MKAQLLVNLKIGRGDIVTAGAVYSDVDGTLPEFVTQNLDNPRIFRILDNTPVKEALEEEAVEEEAVEEEAVEEEAVEEEAVEEEAVEEETAAKKPQKGLSRRK